MMDVRPPELSRLTLMCRDHEVAEFTWNHDRQAVTGKTHVFDAGHAPLMSVDPYGQHHARQALDMVQEQRHPRLPPRCRRSGCAPSAFPRPLPSWPPVSEHRCPTNTGFARPARSSTWRDVNCFENDFSEELGKLLAFARRLVGPLPHREDQGQRGPPRLLARRGPERQPAEALDDRGRAAGAGQVRAHPPAGSRNRSTRRSPACCARNCSTRMTTFPTNSRTAAS